MHNVYCIHELHRMSVRVYSRPAIVRPTLSELCPLSSVSNRNVALVPDTTALHTVSALSIAASFYRATRMHSADYAMARCLSVCPSVCHTPVFCRNS